MILAGVYGGSLAEMLFIVVFAGGLGVLIDLDHFVVARLNTGSWEPFVRAIRSPVRSFLDQEDIFTERAVPSEDRVVTHLLVGGALTGGLWYLLPEWGYIAAVVIYLHLLTDAIADAFDLY